MLLARQHLRAVDQNLQSLTHNLRSIFAGRYHGRELLGFSVPHLNNTGKAQALGVSADRAKGTLEALVEYGMEVLPINIQVAIKRCNDQ